MAHLETAGRRSAPARITSELTDGLHPGEVPPARWLSLAVAATVLTIWELLARMGAISTLFFPAPSTILATLLHLLVQGELLHNGAATLSRLCFGLLLGGLPALLLGWVMGWSPRLRALVDPFVAAAHPIPKIAVLPLVMVLFGIGEAPKLIVVAVAAFFPMLLNVVAGVRHISPVCFEVADNYGAGTLKLFTRVIVPGSLPLVLVGARIAFNVALLLTISVELVAAPNGLGKMVWMAWQTLRTEELYACLAVTASIGIGFNFLLDRLVAALVPWHTERAT